MKKHIFAITAIISIFFCTQTIPMDKQNSAQSIQKFENFLRSKVASEINNLIDDIYANLDYDILIEWKQQILDNTQRLGISLEKAKEVFIATVRNCIIQDMALQLPNATLQSLEATYWNLFRAEVNYAADVIFDPRRMF
jgi:hypothetical protein